MNSDHDDHIKKGEHAEGGTEGPDEHVIALNEEFAPGEAERTILKNEIRDNFRRTLGGRKPTQEQISAARRCYEDYRRLVGSISPQDEAWFESEIKNLFFDIMKTGSRDYKYYQGLSSILNRPIAFYQYPDYEEAFLRGFDSILDHQGGMAVAREFYDQLGKKQDGSPIDISRKISEAMVYHFKVAPGQAFNLIMLKKTFSDIVPFPEVMCSHPEYVHSFRSAFESLLTTLPFSDLSNASYFYDELGVDSQGKKIDVQNEIEAAAIHFSYASDKLDRLMDIRRRFGMSQKLWAHCMRNFSESRFPDWCTRLAGLAFDLPDQPPTQRHVESMAQLRKHFWIEGNTPITEEKRVEFESLLYEAHEYVRSRLVEQLIVWGVKATSDFKLTDDQNKELHYMEKEMDQQIHNLLQQIASPHLMKEILKDTDQSDDKDNLMRFIKRAA